MEFLEKLSNYVSRGSTKAYFGEECYEFEKNFDKSKIEKFQNILKEKYSKIYKKEEIMMLGSRKALCPYCNVLLPKFPAQKTKCKNCHNFYYKRSRLRDGKEVIVTAEERDFIDIEIKKYNSLNPFAYQYFIDETIRKYDIRNELIEKGIDNPSELEILEIYLMEQVKINIKKNDIGIAFTNYLELGEQQLKNKLFEKAFYNFCIALYLVVNGPNNSDTGPRFTPKQGIVPGGLVDLLLRSCKQIYQSNDEIKIKFIEINKATWKKFKPPLTPEEVWEKVKEKWE